MIITYHGKQFFKLKQGETVLAFNPISLGFDKKATRFGADIVISTTNLPEYNGIETVTYSKKEPFVIDGPGEFEVNDFIVHGFLNKDNQNDKQFVNTSYLVHVDGMTILFTGIVDSLKSLSDDLLGSVDDLDIIFVPLDSQYSEIDPAKAYSMAKSVGAKVFIPMDWSDKDQIDTFCKDGSAERENVDKLSIRQRDIGEQVGRIILINE